jgi:membrane protein required for colicin V production
VTQAPTATVAWLGLGWVDWTLVLLWTVSVLVGLWRGLVYELLSLAAWLMAWLVALNWGPDLAARLPLHEAGAMPRVALGYALAFMGTLVIGAVLARLLRLLVAATPLRWIDRLLGALFGAARGALLLLAVAIVVGWTPLAQSAAWQGSQAAAWLGHAAAAWQAWRPQPAR